MPPGRGHLERGSRSTTTGVGWLRGGVNNLGRRAWRGVDPFRPCSRCLPVLQSRDEVPQPGERHVGGALDLCRGQPKAREPAQERKARVATGRHPRSLRGSHRLLQRHDKRLAPGREVTATPPPVDGARDARAAPRLLGRATS